MKKGIYLSCIVSMGLHAAVDMQSIKVEAKIDSEIVKDVSSEEIKSADLADALFKQSPSVSMIRRSGIANDIIVRGQKKDNINVTIDGAKVHGACPNRMDPPISHILTNNVDFIEINEGPYNVEDFGVLSADIKVHTMQPKEDFEGELNLGMGSFGYQKAALSLSGGTEDIRFLLSASTEKGEQYEDGDGNDFVGQITREIEAANIPKTVQYQDKYKNMDAYKKQTLLAKIFWNIADNQELKLSYTANRSDDILYPSSKMDALYDDSNIYNAEYTIKELGAFSKELSIQAYQSEVEHPMSTKYRLMGATNYVTHALTTEVKGLKLKNNFEISNHNVTAGLDYSMRNWDGGYYKNSQPFPAAKFHSIWDVDTENKAFFIKDTIALDRWTVDLGLRYDTTDVTSASILQDGNTYEDINGYIFASYQMNEDTKYFMGMGKSSRVPDAKELYWVGSMGNAVGTPNLKHTVNYEIDLGFETQMDNSSLKAKIFYSKLENYIAYNASNVNKMGASMNSYENVDAVLYGVELSGTYVATESIYFDYGVSYQEGEKDTPLSGQTGTNMPDIAPLKLNASMNYEYDESLLLGAEIIAVNKWSKFDSENGEQELDAYTVVNLKGSKKFAKNIELTVGIDNVLDKTYAVSNTYKDLVLLPTVDNNKVMLLSESGRYIYTNLKYTF